MWQIKGYNSRMKRVLNFKIDLGLSFMTLDLTYKVSMRGTMDGWKWVKFKAIHDKVRNMCNISWYNYSFWFSLLPWIPNSVRVNRLSSPNTHQSLCIASNNTIYMILGHSRYYYISYSNMFPTYISVISSVWSIR